nr:PREDICTED: uncharacterized protein LOC105661788 isoform X2 [Megachile rotundata]
MSNQLQTSTSLQKTAVSNSQKKNSNFSVKRKCYELFFSCFKNVHKREFNEDINHHFNKYDYIVEKLVVKRVPSIFLEISVSASETNDENFIKNIQPSLVKMNTVDPNKSKSQPLIHSSKDSNDNTIPANVVNNSLKIDSNIIIPNKSNNKLASPINHDTSVIELMNSLTSLHPDLKECERPPKDPCPLITPINETELSGNTEKIPSITRFSSNSNASQKQEMMKSKTYVLEPFLLQKEFGDVKSPVMKSKNKQRIYYSIHDTYFNEFQDNYTCNKKETFVVQRDQDNSTEKFKQILNKLQQNQQVLTNESKVLVFIAASLKFNGLFILYIDKV